MRKSKAKSKDKPNADGSMSVSGHLKELRNRILVCVILLFVAFGICLSFAPTFITYLTKMGEAYNYVFVYIAPQELLLVYLNTALIAALVCCFPVIAYEAYAFCSPGLKKKERFFIIASLLAGSLFFLLGVAFARFISLPFVLRFLIQFTHEVDVSASISIQQYISFLLTLFVIFGLVFELPVISVLLTGLGLIKAEWLVKGRKVMIVIIFVMAAIITPPDDRHHLCHGRHHHPARCGVPGHGGCPDDRPVRAQHPAQPSDRQPPQRERRRRGYRRRRRVLTKTPTARWVLFLIWFQCSQSDCTVRGKRQFVPLMKSLRPLRIVGRFGKSAGPDQTIYARRGKLGGRHLLPDRAIAETSHGGAVSHILW